MVVLFAGESEEDEPAARSFFDEMRRLGWVEGTNITYERLEGRGEREYVEGLARSAAGRPGLKRFGLLLDRRAPDSSRQETMYQDAARRVGLDLMTEKFTNFEAVAKIFANLRRAGIVAVGLTPSYTLIARRREVVETAVRNRLALIGHRSEWAAVGALMTYGAEVADALRRSAGIADRILKGVKPADIAVEQATKAELVVNQRTAKTLGITIPDSVLRRADRVIE